MQSLLTMAALLLMTSAFSTKPNLDVVSSGSMGGIVAFCTKICGLPHTYIYIYIMICECLPFRQQNYASSI